jgi:hypothetical protein
MLQAGSPRLNLLSRLRILGRGARLSRNSLRFSSALVLFFAACCGVQVVHAQQWSGILDPSRAVDWSRPGVIGGIPNRTTICATLNPGATSAQIGAALQNCPSGQVVFLNAGTYTINSGIDFGGGKSNVTLRGAGANQTFLVFTGGTGCNGPWANVCMHSSDTNWRGGPSNTANWTAGYAKGTTVITLSGANNLSVGKFIILDQLDDVADGGGIYVCQVGGPIGSPLRCNDDGPNGGPSGGQRDGRAQQQIVRVTAINGNQVTISPGLYMPNWRASQNPGAWWATDPAAANGLENLSLDHTASDERYGIVLFNCNNCWVRGVRSVNSDRAHIHAHISARVVVRDSYFYGTKNSVSQSYGVEAYPSADMLVENNIFHRITAPQMINASCSGCVFSYNFAINNIFTPSPLWLSHSAFIHAGGTDSILFEGNVGAGLFSDNFHGSHHFVTAFRNYYIGWEVNRPENAHAFNLYPFSRFYNIIGNVLGRAGFHQSYQAIPDVPATRPIYVLGTGAGEVQEDPATVSTLMRWGNYDVVNGTRFLPSEVPNGLAQFANPIPANQTLPASFYLSGKPAWFGAIAFPPIGPDVTGGNIPDVGGHANRIPAQGCYSNVMGGPADGSGGPLPFDANICYNLSSPQPNAPGHLSYTIH